MSDLISSFFHAEHDRLNCLLQKAVTASGEIDATVFAEFRAGLLKHIAQEEKIILPALRRARGGEPVEIARRLRVDHGAVALLLVPSPTRELVGEIRSILEPHHELEDGAGGLYAMCDELLREEADQIVERARTYPDVKVAPHNDAPGVYRTAREALAISDKQSAYRSAKTAPRP